MALPVLLAIIISLIVVSVGGYFVLQRIKNQPSQPSEPVATAPQSSPPVPVIGPFQSFLAGHCNFNSQTYERVGTVDIKSKDFPVSIDKSVTDQYNDPANGCYLTGNYSSDTPQNSIKNLSSLLFVSLSKQSDSSRIDIYDDSALSMSKETATEYAFPGQLASLSDWPQNQVVDIGDDVILGIYGESSPQIAVTCAIGKSCAKHPSLIKIGGIAVKKVALTAGETINVAISFSFLAGPNQRLSDFDKEHPYPIGYYQPADYNLALTKEFLGDSSELQSPERENVMSAKRILDAIQSNRPAFSVLNNGLRYDLEKIQADPASEAEGDTDTRIVSYDKNNLRKIVVPSLGAIYRGNLWIRFHKSIFPKNSSRLFLSAYRPASDSYYFSDVPTHYYDLTNGQLYETRISSYFDSEDPTSPNQLKMLNLGRNPQGYGRYLYLLDVLNDSVTKILELPPGENLIYQTNADMGGPSIKIVWLDDNTIQYSVYDESVPLDKTIINNIYYPRKLIGTRTLKL